MDGQRTLVWCWPDPETLDSLENVFINLDRDGWKVLLFTEKSKVVDALDAGPVHVVVTSLSIQGVPDKGLRLLRELRNKEFPHKLHLLVYEPKIWDPKVVNREATIRACKESGADFVSPLDLDLCYAEICRRFSEPSSSKGPPEDVVTKCSKLIADEKVDESTVLHLANVLLTSSRQRLARLKNEAVRPHSIPSSSNIWTETANVLLELAKCQKETFQLMEEKKSSRVSRTKVGHVAQLARELVSEYDAHKKELRQDVADKVVLLNKLKVEKDALIDRLNAQVTLTEMPVPPWWGGTQELQIAAEKHDGYLELPLEPNSPLFQMMEVMMNCSGGAHKKVRHGLINGVPTKSFVVTGVSRIVNVRLWDEYCHSKKLLLARWNDLSAEAPSKYLVKHPMTTPFLDARTNEYWMFHGTAAANVKILLQKGYDPRVCSVDGMFGGGFYFAENATKSNMYIPCPGCGGNAVFQQKACKCKNPESFEYDMIVYRATLGDVHVALEYDQKTYKGTPKAPVRRPPAKVGGFGETYDCVLGEKGSHLMNRELVMYQGNQAYPEFVIRYCRRGELDTIQRRFTPADYYKHKFLPLFVKTPPEPQKS